MAHLVLMMCEMRFLGFRMDDAEMEKMADAPRMCSTLMAGPELHVVVLDSSAEAEI